MDDSNGCINSILIVLLSIAGALLGILFVLLLTDASGFEMQRGEIFYCSGKSYLDIAENDPLEIRFTCEDENGFETTFGGPPNDQKLIEEIRDNAEVKWGLGVIVRDGQIVQLFEYKSLYLKNHWSTEMGD